MLASTKWDTIDMNSSLPFGSIEMMKLHEIIRKQCDFNSIEIRRCNFKANIWNRKMQSQNDRNQMNAKWVKSKWIGERRQTEMDGIERRIILSMWCEVFVCLAFLFIVIV